MNLKEITAMRKSGHLAEALEAAEAEFARNASPYTAATLFWCLNDLLKQQSGPEAAETFGRMQQLRDLQGADDEYMNTTLASLKSRMIPHRAEVKEALARAKEGDRQASLPIERLHAAGELDPSLLHDFGWMLFYTLKHTPAAETDRRKQLLATYLKLELPRPATLHSLILSEAVKVEQQAPAMFRLRDFLRLWGPGNLRDEDWRQFTTKEGNTLPSLVEKLVGACAKELHADAAIPDPEFVDLLDRALATFPNNQNLPYFKALTLMAMGEKEQAVDYYKGLIARYPRKSFLWDKLSTLTDDAATRVALLCKAAGTCDDEAFLGTVRLRLAAALLELGLPAAAKTELELYRQACERQGRRLKSDFARVAASIPADVAPADNSGLYSQYLPAAEEFIYDALPTLFAVKAGERILDDRNHPGRSIRQWTLRSNEDFLNLKNPHRYGLDPAMPDGTVFSIKAPEGKIVWIKPVEQFPSLSWLKKTSGTVSLRTDRNGHLYTLVDGVFVADRLLAGLADGDSISITALRQKDGRWTAVSRN